MKTYEEFELSPFQIEMLKKQNAKSKIKRYIKKYGTAPENMEQFYTYTQKQYDVYKSIAYSEYASKQLMNENIPDIPDIQPGEESYNSDYTEILYDNGLMQSYNVSGIFDLSNLKNGSVTTIKIGSTVTGLSNVNNFSKSSLTDVVVSIGNKDLDSRNNCNAVINTKTNTLLLGCKNTIIPNSVISLGEGSFSRCNTLELIEIPDSITLIGGHTFSECTSLLSIELPSYITSINEYTFSGCNSLASIEIPSSVTSISNYAFSGCNSLTSSIELPNSITTIGEHVFSTTEQFTSFYIHYNGSVYEWENLLNINSITDISNLISGHYFNQIFCTDGIITYLNGQSGYWGSEKYIEYQINTPVTYYYHLILKNKQTSEPIVGTRVVYESDKSVNDVYTDNNGNAIWTSNYPILIFSITNSFYTASKYNVIVGKYDVSDYIVLELDPIIH